jgi:mono/diheme cytochrome c family protein
MNRLLGASSALIAICTATLADAQNANDIVAGRQLAVEVCSVCHAVATDQEFGPRLGQTTPSFEEIANRPDTSVESLRKFITTTHWDEHTIPMTMPNPMLSDGQITQVSSYIFSLRQRR